MVVNITAGLSARGFYVDSGYTFGLGPIYPDQMGFVMEFMKENWDTYKPAGAADEIKLAYLSWPTAFGQGALTDESRTYLGELGIEIVAEETYDLSPTADTTTAIGWPRTRSYVACDDGVPKYKVTIVGKTTTDGRLTVGQGQVSHSNDGTVGDSKHSVGGTAIYNRTGRSTGTTGPCQTRRVRPSCSNPPKRHDSVVQTPTVPATPTIRLIR